jgi:L-fuculose-phosphate aldolase
MDTFVKQIIDVGRWIWEKDLSSGMSGNISIKVSDKVILITGRGTCLGMLKEEDVCTIDLEGKPLKKDFVPSSEKLFHTSVYKNLEAQAIVHLHPTFCNGYFAMHDRIAFDTFETRLTLGDIPVIDQKTPTITDISPVIEALRKSNVVVLKHHGVVAIGETLNDVFFLAQTLEEAVKIACIKDLYAQNRRDASLNNADSVAAPGGASRSAKKYKIFTPEQMEEIVKRVNADAGFRQLALETSLETKLAVVLDETQDTYCFHFSNGGIKEFTRSASEAEFIISGKGEYWRAIFERQLDPFAATTQKKLKLKGDFAKISRWYVPFNRLFDLWTNVPVE